MTALATLFADDSLACFLRENYGRLPYARPLAAMAFVDALNEQRVGALLAQSKATFRIVKDRRMIHDVFRGSFGGLQAYRQAGASVVIRHCEASDPLCRALAADFARTLGGSVDVQAFLTPAHSSSFDWHFDSEHVFLVQCSGAKKFLLRESTAPHAPSFSCLLHAGDWLYIPWGWWHRGVALGEATNLSIGIVPN